MATRKSKASPPMNRAALSRAQEIRIQEAAQAFFNIYRLAVLCVQQIGTRTGDDDADPLLQAIEDIAELHGRRLDALLQDAPGWFDEDDRRRGLAPVIQLAEAVNG